MKAICSRAELLKALQLLRIVAKPGAFIPQAAGVLIVGRGESLKLTADNHDTMCRIEIPAEIGDEGSVVVSADRLGRLLTYASDDKLKIDVKDGKSADLICGGVKAHLPGWAEAEFLHRLEFEGQSSFQIGLSELKAAISRVAPALMTGASQTVKSGVHLISDDSNGLKIEGCDGRALHVSYLDMLLTSRVDAILPPSVVELIQSLNGEGDCDVSISEKAIQITSGAVIQAQLLEGTFPNTDAIIPAQSDKSITLLKDDLIRAINVARTVMDNKGPCRLKISAQKEAIAISSHLAEMGDVQEIIETPNSYEVEFFIDAARLLTAVKLIESKEVTIQCDDPLMAICIREGDFVAVIATMRIPPPIQTQ